MPNSSLPAPIRIGTRGSPLAVAQAVMTRGLLMQAHDLPLEAFEIVTISTKADRVLDKVLKEIGGKGLFTKELEEALLDGRIDFAVHCVKDMGVVQPKGLISDVHLTREDPRDVFVSKTAKSLADLPEGAVLGTSSLRRKAQTLARRPDLNVVNFRGNVQARLRKLEEGVADATYLALAGLNRLGMTDHGWRPVEPEDMLPAIGQGALSIQRRKNDEDTAALIEVLNDPRTEVEMACERSFLATLEGSCETPIAGLARLEGDVLWFRGEILRTDGTEVLTCEGRCEAEDAADMGAELARELLEQAAPDFFDWKRPQE